MIRIDAWQEDRAAQVIAALKRHAASSENRHGRSLEDAKKN